MLIDPWGNPLFGENTPPPIPQPRQSYESPLMANGYDRTSRSQPQTIANNSPSYRERLSQQWNKTIQGADELSSRAYAGSRNMYGNNNLATPSSRDFAVATQAGRNTLGQQLKPTNWAGAANIGAAGLGGAMNLVNSINQGVDADDAIGQSVGLGLGAYGGGAAGAALGSAAAPFLATLGPIGMVGAAAAPFLGQAIGSMVGSGVGRSVGGAAVDLFDRDDDFSSKKNERSIEGLGNYASFLSPDDQQALGSYLAFSKAQQDLSRDDAMFADAMARDQFREAAKIDFDNNASLETLRSRAAMEQDRQRSNYELAMNNSNNLWSGINNNVNAMAALYR